MSGRWLATEHRVTEALGSRQFTHTFVYYEITQNGTSLEVTKGLHCGDDTVGDGVFSTNLDFAAASAATASRLNYIGRTGSSTPVAGSCQVDLEKWYTVKGATLPYYLDPNVPLPTAEQPATGNTPGWEDWDQDGNPGITGVLSGIISGELYVAPRVWTSISGVAPDVAKSFTLPLDWDQEANVMAYDGSSLLGSSSARAADESLHFIEFARLGADQATGDDATICAAVTMLAPMLTPEATGL